MKYIEINEHNIETEHICCAIGNDKVNKTRALTKKKWMSEQFKQGLVFKRLNERGKVFIEYMPLENAWKPVIGDNYMMINCLWISGRFKGKGYSSELLDFCIEDAKQLGMNGIAVVTGSKVKPFLTDKRFFIKHGFVMEDKGYPYFELLVLKFNNNAPVPVFSENARSGRCENDRGFTFIYSDQCPFMEEYVGLLSDVSKKRGISSSIIKLENSKQAKDMGSPFGTLGIYYNGEFQTHELMTEKKFNIFIDSLKS